MAMQRPTTIMQDDLHNHAEYFCHPDTRAMMRQCRKPLIDGISKLREQEKLVWNPEVCRELLVQLNPNDAPEWLVEIMTLLGVTKLPTEQFDLTAVLMRCWENCTSIRQTLTANGMDNTPEQMATIQLLVILSQKLEEYRLILVSIVFSATYQLSPNAPTFDKVAVPPARKAARKGYKGYKSAQYLVATYFPERLQDLLASMELPQQYTKHSTSFLEQLTGMLVGSNYQTHQISAGYTKWVTVDTEQLNALLGLASNSLIGMYILNQDALPNIIASVNVTDLIAAMQSVNSNSNIGDRKMSSYEHHQYTIELNDALMPHVKMWTGMFSMPKM